MKIENRLGLLHKTNSLFRMPPFLDLTCTPLLVGQSQDANHRIIGTGFCLDIYIIIKINNNTIFENQILLECYKFMEKDWRADLESLLDTKLITDDDFECTFDGTNFRGEKGSNDILVSSKNYKNYSCFDRIETNFYSKLEAAYSQGVEECVDLKHREWFLEVFD